MTKLHLPWPSGRRINPNGKYGWRIHPKTGRRAFHTGVDVGGTYPVTVAADGTVVTVGWNHTGGGHTVVINHGEIHTAYFHGRERSVLKVGQKVKAGDFVYVSGATGVATGPHLHFEVRRSRNQSTHIDPTPYLNGAPSPTPVIPTSLTVDGVMDAPTWMAWQKVLKANYGYEGRIDGIPGPMTNRAIQRSIRAYGYLGPISGNLGRFSRMGVQRRLSVPADGVWGRITITALQKALNAGSY
jgi:murein DD-endopeptidase